jgi:hypothetical protein
MARTILKVKEIEQGLLSVTGLQEYLGGVGSRSVQQRWRESKQLQFYIMAGKILYRKADVDKFVEKHRVIPPKALKPMQ